MACKECKKKTNSEPVKIEKLEWIAKIFLIVWSAFALFGIYSLIKLIF